MAAVSTLMPHREWRHGRMWFHSHLRRCCSPWRTWEGRAPSVWRPTTPPCLTEGSRESSAHSGSALGRRRQRERASARGPNLPPTGRGRSTGSLSRGIAGRRRMSLQLRRGPQAEAMLSPSVGFLPIGCPGPTPSVLGWKPKTADDKEVNQSWKTHHFSGRHFPCFGSGYGQGLVDFQYKCKFHISTSPHYNLHHNLHDQKLLGSSSIHIVPFVIHGRKILIYTTADWRVFELNGLCSSTH